MKTLLPALLLILSSPLATAHPGHDAAASPLLHYLSGDHLVATLVVVALVGVLVRMGVRRRRQ